MQAGSPHTGQGFSASNCQKEGRVLPSLNCLSSSYHLTSFLPHFTYWDQLPNESLASNFLSQGLLLRQPRHKVILTLSFVTIFFIASYLKVSNFSLFTCRSSTLPSCLILLSLPTLSTPLTRCPVKYKHLWWGQRTLSSSHPMFSTRYHPHPSQ